MLLQLRFFLNMSFDEHKKLFVKEDFKKHLIKYLLT